MLWKIFQGLVMFAILSANIHFRLTPNAFIAGAWAFMGAYALTVFPFQIYDWWTYRRTRKQSLRGAVRPAVGVLDEPAILDRSRRRLSRKRGADLRL